MIEKWSTDYRRIRTRKDVFPVYYLVNLQSSADGPKSEWNSRKTIDGTVLDSSYNI